MVVILSFDNRMILCYDNCGSEKQMGTRALSHREHDILEFVAKGCSNKEIGDALSISCQTVKNHVTSLMMKLDVRNRTELAITAHKLALVKEEVEAKEETQGGEETAISCFFTGGECQYVNCPLWSKRYETCLWRVVLDEAAKYMLTHREHKTHANQW